MNNIISSVWYKTSLHISLTFLFASLDYSPDGHGSNRTTVACASSVDSVLLDDSPARSARHPTTPAHCTDKEEATRSGCCNQLQLQPLT